MSREYRPYTSRVNRRITKETPGHRLAPPKNHPRPVKVGPDDLLSDNRPPGAGGVGGPLIGPVVPGRLRSEAVMSARVVRCEGSHRLSGEDGSDDLVNRFLDHLVTRGFSSATVRACAFDLANLLAFIDEGALTIGQVRAVDLFAHLDWQRKQRVGVAVSTMNRRVSTVRVPGDDRGTRREPGAETSPIVGTADRAPRHARPCCSVCPLRAGGWPTREPAVSVARESGSR